MGLGLPLVKSTLVNFQAYCNTALEALMELRSQDSVFLRTAGALPSTSSREGVKTLRPRKGGLWAAACVFHSAYPLCTHTSGRDRETVRR